MTDIICGVDVAADLLEACLGPGPGPAHRFANTADGIATLAAFCRHHQVGLLVMEATGGYEHLAFGLLCQQGIPVAIVNPRAVRCFAQAMGLPEKTDRIDAGVIAWYAQTKHVVPQPPASETQQRLDAAVTRLRQLTDTRVAQRNQRRLVTDPDICADFDTLIALLTAQIRSLERRIAQLIAADPLWAALDRAFRTIKGVADRTVGRLVAEMPEIGTLSNKAIAKLAGLAPIANDSGKHAGRRAIRGGRKEVRSILFIVAEVVRRHEPDFRDFAQRLKAAGKPPKVIRVALAHKLLVRLNAKARDVRNSSPCTP